MSIPGVTAIGVGLIENDAMELTNDIGLIVYHEDPDPALYDQIAKKVGEVPLQIRKGKFSEPKPGEKSKSLLRHKKEQTKQAPLSTDPRNKKTDPMIGGISVSPDYWSWTESFGTLGFVVYDKNRNPVILSNEHVICRENPQVGDDVSQPYRVWFGDLAAKIIAWKKGNIEYKDRTYGIDAAIASIAEGRSATVGEIYGFKDKPQGITSPQLGMEVIKSGVSSDITKGRIDGFYDVKSPNMKNQIGIRSGSGVFSEKGDSGSIVVDCKDNLVIGLLWGGNDELSLSLASPIVPILHYFDCSLV